MVASAQGLTPLSSTVSMSTTVSNDFRLSPFQSQQWSPWPTWWTQSAEGRPLTFLGLSSISWLQPQKRPCQHSLTAFSLTGPRPLQYLSKLESVYFANHTRAFLDTEQLLPVSPPEPCLHGRLSANRPPWTSHGGCFLAGQSSRHVEDSPGFFLTDGSLRFKRNTEFIQKCPKVSL